MRKDFVSFENVDFTNGFWKDRYELNKNVSIKNVQIRFEESGRFDAMRFNFLKNGKKPHIFFDSDVAKWIEAVAYLYAKDSEGTKEYVEFCDELIDRMAQAQRDDGYLNSTHQQITPELIFKNRGRHELYCTGHLIEAAIAYHKATGKDKFLSVMERCCEYIHKVFMVDKSAAFITPGHEEIELALFKLYEHTKKELYKKMAIFFLEKRGNKEEELIFASDKYAQDDVDIYNLREANGHSVRALYLYSAIADMAAYPGYESLKVSLDSVFEDITERKMYITGGVGSTYRGESFTVAYDLPNATAYSESCCAIAMLLFASRMRKLEKNAKYGHVSERVLYNSLLSSTSLDGKSFFYENPLEIALGEYDRELAVEKSKRERLPIKTRVEVFNCSCCPPNINRIFANLGSYLVFEDEDALTVEQYIAASFSTSYGNLRIEEDYAVSGKASVSSDNYAKDKISLRLPEWCDKPVVILNGEKIDIESTAGYIDVNVGASFKIELDFGIKPVFVSSNPLVRANAGRIALSYGPVIYCLEMKDNCEKLDRISVDVSDAENATVEKDFHGLCSITVPAYKLKAQKALYYIANDENERINAKFIPYFAFANRGESDMLVWVRRK